MDLVDALVVLHSEEEAIDDFLVCEVGDGILHLHKASSKLMKGLAALFSNALNVVDPSREPPSAYEVGDEHITQLFLVVD